MTFDIDSVRLKRSLLCLKIAERGKFDDIDAYFYVCNFIFNISLYSFYCLLQIKYHNKELKFECPTCGRKFHLKSRYKEHCSTCERNMLKPLNSTKRYNERYHSDESNLKNLRIDQDQEQAPNNNLKMEITEEDTTISARDDQRQSTVYPSTEVEVSSGQRLTEVIYKKSRRPFVTTLNGSSEGEIVSEESSQAFVENQSNQRYVCNICGIDLYSSNRFSYHMVCGISGIFIFSLQYFLPVHSRSQNTRKKSSNAVIVPGNFTMKGG